MPITKPTSVCPECGSGPTRLRRCRRCHRAHLKLETYTLWARALNFYGSQCRCCGSINAGELSIVNPHEWPRRTYHALTWYRNLVRDGFPAFYETRCETCRSGDRDPDPEHELHPCWHFFLAHTAA